jgi:hypothetical protein
MPTLLRYVLIAGAILLGLFLVAYGFSAIYGMDFHENPFLSIAYCALPFLALPALLLGLRWRGLAVVPALLAVTYLAVYSALNGRTCGSVGDCGSMASTVLTTLRTHSAIAFFGAAILSFAAASLKHKQPVDG